MVGLSLRTVFVSVISLIWIFSKYGILACSNQVIVIDPSFIKECSIFNESEEFGRFSSILPFDCLDCWPFLFEVVGALVNGSLKTSTIPSSVTALTVLFPYDTEITLLCVTKTVGTPSNGYIFIYLSPSAAVMNEFEVIGSKVWIGEI